MKTIEEKIAVMQAFADGKEIENCPLELSGHWLNCSQPLWDWKSYDHRVKEEEPKAPKYVHFTFEDAEFLIGKVVKSKDEKWIEMLTWASENETSNITYEALLRDFTFIDGSPCGKLKQQ